MKPEFEALFGGIATIIFKFPDGTTLRSTTSLNPSILDKYGVSELDGIVDLDTRKLIPDDYFDLEFDIQVGVVPLESPLDVMFNAGGKVGW